MDWIRPEDLVPFAEMDRAKAQAMIDDAQAVAVLAAPNLVQITDPNQLQALKAILRGAILRWEAAGSGGIASRSETAGAFTVSESFDSRTTRRGIFWPSELEQLKALADGAKERQAFAVDTYPGRGRGAHMPWCSLYFGANYCSCGTDINGGISPIYEGGNVDGYVDGYVL